MDVRPSNCWNWGRAGPVPRRCRGWASLSRVGDQAADGGARPPTDSRTRLLVACPSSGWSRHACLTLRDETLPAAGRPRSERAAPLRSPEELLVEAIAEGLLASGDRGRPDRSRPLPHQRRCGTAATMALLRSILGAGGLVEVDAALGTALACSASRCQDMTTCPWTAPAFLAVRARCWRRSSRRLAFLLGSNSSVRHRSPGRASAGEIVREGVTGLVVDLVTSRSRGQCAVDIKVAPGTLQRPTASSATSATTPRSRNTTSVVSSRRGTRSGGQCDGPSGVRRRRRPHPHRDCALRRGSGPGRHGAARPAGAVMRLRQTRKTRPHMTTVRTLHAGAGRWRRVRRSASLHQPAPSCTDNAGARRHPA